MTEEGGERMNRI